MSTRRKDLTGLMSVQQKLFDNQITEGPLDVSMLFRDSLEKAVRALTSDSRYIVAAKISELVGRAISKDMLDKYTSNNQDYGLRAEHLPAFCVATQSVEPFKVLLAPLGHEVISPEDGKLVKLAKLTQRRRELDAEILRLEVSAGIKR